VNHPAPPGLGPVVEVDTSAPVDIAQLAATLAQVLATTQGRPRYPDLNAQHVAQHRAANRAGRRF
jgi:hypothetical protein